MNPRSVARNGGLHLSRPVHVTTRAISQMGLHKMGGHVARPGLACTWPPRTSNPFRRHPVSCPAISSFQSMLNRAEQARVRLVIFISNVIKSISQFWSGWPGFAIRLTGACILLSTIILNALVVPYANDRILPQVEASASHISGRSVFLEGIKWVSPPGIVGMGPVIALDHVTIGPRAAEQSEACVDEVTLSIAPLKTLLTGKVVLSADIKNANVTLRQSNNYSWFGYPLDSNPSARDFVPGLTSTSTSSSPKQDEFIVTDRPAPGVSTDGSQLAQRQASNNSATTSASDPPVHLNNITLSNSHLSVFATGDPHPRRITNVSATMALGVGYSELDLDISGDPYMRDSASLACTMPTDTAERNLRHCTPGGEVAVINRFPITRQGPSPLSLEKMQRDREKAGETSHAPTPPPYSPPAPLPIVQSMPMPRSRRTQPSTTQDGVGGRASLGVGGGHIAVRVTATDMGVENVWPSCKIVIDGDNLHAPLIDRLLEIPMDVYDGRLSGSLELSMHDEATWDEFPAFLGRIHVNDGGFHFWDAPDDFSATNMTLMFEKDRVYLHNAQGTYGAVRMSVGGDIGLNPEQGQYSIQAKVDSVDVNALRATLGARPLPYPIAGAVGGSLQCYGPLDSPVFTGSVEARPLSAIGYALADRTDAYSALVGAREAGHLVDLAYDKVPFTMVRGIFSMDTASSMLSIQTLQGTPVGGGVVKGNGRMTLDPASVADPSAVKVEFLGEGLNPVTMAPYAPALQEYMQGHGVLEPVSMQGRMQGSHLAPVIRIGCSMPSRQSDAIVVLARDHSSVKIRAPAMDVSATVKTEFLPFETQQTAMTQAAAIAMREPLVKGGSVHADIRSLDVLPLLKGLQADGEANGHPILLHKSIDPSRMQVNGQLKLWVHAVEDPKQSNLNFAEGADSPQSQKDGISGIPAPEFMGKVELKSFRLNQLQLAKSLEGTFNLRDQRLEMSATGSRHSEKLQIGVNLPGLAAPGSQPVAAGSVPVRTVSNLTRAPLAPIVPPQADSKNRVDDDAILPSPEPQAASGGPDSPDDTSEGAEHSVQVTEAVDSASYSSIELRCGHLLIQGDLDDDMSQIKIKIANLALDDLEMASLRGTIKDLDIDVDLATLSGHGKLIVKEPRYEGLTSHKLHVEANAVDGVLTLVNTSLKQDLSNYDVEGEFTLPRPANMSTSSSPPDTQPPATSDTTTDTTTDCELHVTPADLSAPRHDDGTSATDESVALSSTTDPDTASLVTDTTPVMENEHSEVTERLDTPSSQPENTDQDSPTYDSPGVGVEVVETVASPAASTWWVRLKADAQLQDIMPAAELFSREPESPVDSEMAKAAFFEAVREQSWTFGDPRPSTTLGNDLSGSTTAASPLPGLSALKGHLKGDITAFGGQDGTSQLRFDVEGNAWNWGHYTMEQLLVAGDLDSKQGLQLEKCTVRAEGAQLDIKGCLLGQDQEATVKLEEFPLDLLEPLVQAALPNLQRPRSETPSSYGPVTRPLAALQRQLRRAAEALELTVPKPDKGQTSNSPIRGMLFVDGAVTGSVDAMEGKVTARIDKASLGNVPLAEAGAEAILMGNQMASVRGKLVPAGPSGSVTFKGQVHLPDMEQLDAQLDVKDAGMGVLSELAGDTATWSEGKASLSVRAVGSTQAPLVTGKAQLWKAKVASPMLKAPLTGLHANIHVDRGNLCVEQFYAHCGNNGALEMSGTLPLVTPTKNDEARQLNIALKGLEVKVPSVYTGQLDSQVTVGGSVQAPLVGGEVRLSKGSVTAAPADSSKDAKVSEAKSDDLKAASSSTTRTDMLDRLKANKPGPSLRAQSEIRVPGLDELSQSIRSNSAEGVKQMTVDKLNVLLGPDLRFTVPILVQVDLSGAVQLDGPATPEEVLVVGEVKLGSGVVNVLATQFHVDRTHRSVIKFTGEPGLNPVVDVAMVSGDFRIACLDRLDNAANSITFTTSEEGKHQSLGSAADAFLLEQQLKSLILHDDGQLAVQNLAMNALSTMLPRIEGTGQWGKARWRLSGSPTVPLFGLTNDSAGILVGAQGEAEVIYGEKLTAALSSLHLSNAKLSMTYQLAPKVRAYGAFKTPRGTVTLMIQYADTGKHSHLGTMGV